MNFGVICRDEKNQDIQVKCEKVFQLVNSLLQRLLEMAAAANDVLLLVQIQANRFTDEVCFFGSAWLFAGKLLQTLPHFGCHTDAASDRFFRHELLVGNLNNLFHCDCPTLLGLTNFNAMYGDFCTSDAVSASGGCSKAHPHADKHP